MNKIAYSPGEKVRIIDKKHGHHYEIGSVVTIERISYYPANQLDIIYTIDGDWVLASDEVEKLMLKPGEDCIF